MNFQEADYFNAINGNQFIADLMPKHPVYVAMLPETTRSAIGLPHPSGRAAMRMLEGEGFSYEGFIDIFDGGPTMTARTDKVESIANAKAVPVVEICAQTGGSKALVATGHLTGFRCSFATISPAGPSDAGGITLDPEAAAALGVAVGETVWWVAR
jgi:arginine N-succinyltransferase